MSEFDKVLELRKYPNRRYYDTTRSRHVTLEEIQNLVRDGHEVKVTDSKSGEDITARVLTQIILELDSPKLSIFPVPLLHRLIRANEALITDFIEKYFNQALLSFLDSQRQFEQYLRQSLQLSGGTPMITDWTKLMMAPFGNPGEPRPKKHNEQMGVAATAKTGTGHGDYLDLQETIDDLREEMAALRQEMTRRKGVKKVQGE